MCIATVLWLAGCMVGPDYKRPTTEIPPQFRAAMTPDAAPSIADLKWFEVFQDERLQELIRVALVQNYDLRDAIARVDQARANLGITQSDQYPQFGLGVDLPALSYHGREHSRSQRKPPTDLRRSLPQSFHLRDRHLGPAAPGDGIGPGTIAGQRLESQKP